MKRHDMRRKEPKGKRRSDDALLCSANQFARVTGLSAGLIRRMIATGEMPSRLIGTRRWVLRPEAMEWLRNQTLESEDTPLMVDNRLSTVVDTSRAADLFATILRAVREERAEEERRKQPTGETAA
jgi:hypothetical protein